MAQAARRIEAATAETLLLGRQAARAGAHRQVNAELRLAQAGGIELRGDIRPASTLEADRSRVREFGRNHADEWLKDATAGRAPSRAGDSYLEMVATTEVFSAWGDEYEDITQQGARLIRHAERRDATMLLFKVWDSSLDHRMCKLCGALHRTLRPWGAGYGGGRIPGRVHPRCRCRSHTLMLPIWWRDRDRL